ncbi:MAG: hypothetical protein AAGC64_13865, partial [Bacteroidota bacterium]
MLLVITLAGHFEEEPGLLVVFEGFSLLLVVLITFLAQLHLHYGLARVVYLDCIDPICLLVIPYHLDSRFII